ncbi:hypothetical protein [Rubrobacter aplysinae]|uniref:hypothetical protein n=1 Tax=Rubrobacter aplysinae TaxID=909625 RepID=UPI00064B9CB3|nr:hypothetical protein [Rubrobacter aplysinae]
MVTGAAILLGLVGLAVILFGVYAMIRGGRDGNNDSGGASGDRGGLGPIPERGIHVLAGIRLVIFGLVCLAAAAFALFRF